MRNDYVPFPFVHESLTSQDLIDRIDNYQLWQNRIPIDNKRMKFFCEARLQLLYTALRTHYGIDYPRIQVS